MFFQSCFLFIFTLHFPCFEVLFELDIMAAQNNLGFQKQKFINGQ